MGRKNVEAVLSSARQMIRLAASHNGEVFGGRSNERHSHAIRAAAHLACEYGLKFEPDDLVKVCRNPGSYYGAAWVADEGFYSLACGDPAHGGRSHGVNRSACIAYEKFRGRKPWIYRDRHTPSGVRICIGVRLQLVTEDRTWVVEDAKGGSELLTVTSFNDDADSLVACSYHEQPEGSYANKVKRRVTVTREMFETHNRTITAFVNEVKGKKAAEVRDDER